MADLNGASPAAQGSASASSDGMSSAIEELKQKMIMANLPASIVDALFLRSQFNADGKEIVKGYDFNDGLDYERLMASYRVIGFQATNFGLAVNEINRMIAKKKEPLSQEILSRPNNNPVGRPLSNCTIFLGYTSNMVSCGVREIIRYLAQHNMVDCLVTTAGGIEEDIIKCLAPMYIGDFRLDGAELRARGVNRTGNLLVPNDSYCRFEDFLLPLLDTMLEEQRTQGVLWTPSKFIARLGKEINHPESIYYWAYKNNIPVFCPAITDGSLGDMTYFHSYKNPGLVIDLVEDIRRMNNQAVFAQNTGMIILGGGVIKHHICNANLMRNGANFSVYVNTGQEFDGSDSGASPDEAVSWGKIHKDARPIKVHADASLIFPLLVAETFAKEQRAAQSQATASTQ